MATIALVGNAPSSGSTLLSDLLDCTPFSASGPELNLFSNTRLYEFAAYRRDPMRCGASASIYAARDCIYRGELPAYGLDVGGYCRLVESCNDLPGFARTFAARYLALRGKDPGATVFEKTPTNINAIGQFLGSSIDGWFIYAVRNPLHVYTSLLKRGMSPYLALTIWLVDVAQYLPWASHPRVRLVRYEDLVRNPFGVVSPILGEVAGAVDLSEERFMAAYRDNAYTRVYSGRVDTWSVQATGVITDANRKKVAPEILSAFAASLQLAVNPAYARLYGFDGVTMREAIAATGYADTVNELLDGVRPTPAALKLDAGSRRMLLKKAAYAALTGQPSRAGIAALLQPIVRS